MTKKEIRIALYIGHLKIYKLICNSGYSRVRILVILAKDLDDFRERGDKRMSALFRVAYYSSISLTEQIYGRAPRLM